MYCVLKLNWLKYKIMKRINDIIPDTSYRGSFSYHHREGVNSNDKISLISSSFPCLLHGILNT